VDWLCGSTALFPEDEPPMFEPIAIASARARGESVGALS
jgi:hypothetical protein